MTQASFLLLLLLLWSHSSCKHQNYQRSTCASCPRRRMKSLWRWAWKGNRRHSKILCAWVFTVRNIPSLLLRLHFLFCGRGRLMRVPGQWCNFCQMWCKNITKQHFVCFSVVTHSHVTKPCLYFTWHFTKPRCFVYKIALNFLFFFFSFWSGADEKKIIRKWLKGHCPETGEGPAVIRGRAWRSGSPPSGSQTHRSARQRCLHLDQWSNIILGPDTKQICQGTLEQSLWMQMPKWF